MASVAELRRQIAQLDRQVIDLLARRSKMARQVYDRIEDDESGEWEQDVIATWLEEGFDHGMEEAPVEKVCRSVMDMGRKAPEI